MRKNSNTAGFFIVIVFFAFAVNFSIQGIAAENVISTRETVRRDPFVPLVGVDTAKTKRGIENIFTLIDVQFHGIASGAGQKKAVILNGEIIQEGETIGLVTLVSVASNEAKILIDGKEYTISLYETAL